MIFGVRVEDNPPSWDHARPARKRRQQRSEEAITGSAASFGAESPERCSRRGVGTPRPCPVQSACASGAHPSFDIQGDKVPEARCMRQYGPDVGAKEALENGRFHFGCCGRDLHACGQIGECGEGREGGTDSSCAAASRISTGASWSGGRLSDTSEGPSPGGFGRESSRARRRGSTEARDTVVSRGRDGHSHGDGMVGKGRASMRQTSEVQQKSAGTRVGMGVLGERSRRQGNVALSGSAGFVTVGASYSADKGQPRPCRRLWAQLG